MNLHQAARALGGEVVNGQILAPGPAHSKKDRSLAVKFAGERVVVHSYAGDDWRECEAHVRRALGLGEWRDRPRDSEPRRVKPEPTPRADDNGKRGREIFAESVDPRLSKLAVHYLEVERGLRGAIDDRLALTLRFHGAAPYRDGGELVRSPTLGATAAASVSPPLTFRSKSLARPRNGPVRVFARSFRRRSSRRLGPLRSIWLAAAFPEARAMSAESSISPT